MMIARRKTCLAGLGWRSVQRRRGAALLLAIFSVAVCLLLILGYMESVGNRVLMNQQRQAYAQAYANAEAGVEAVLAEIRANPSLLVTSTNLDVPAGSKGSYTAVGSFDGNLWIIDSTGAYRNSKLKLRVTASFRNGIITVYNESIVA